MDAHISLVCSAFSQPPFRQGSTDSCLLASLAAALYPHTGTVESRYFTDCCDLLGIKYTDTDHSVRSLIPQVVDVRLGVITPGTGYQWLENLFANCSGPAFAIARSRAQLRRLQTTLEVELALQSGPHTAIICLHLGNAAHSVAVLHDSVYGFSLRDSGLHGAGPALGADAYAETILAAAVSLYGVNVRIGESILIESVP